MKIKHKLLVAATAIIAAFGINTTTTHAAKYSKTEAKQVRQFQKRYHALSKVKYNKQNIYAQQPNFGLPFSAGVINPSYIPDTMSYVNYYRSLAGLPTELNHADDNSHAQIGAAALAAVNAKKDLNVHGLLGSTRPFYFNETDWNIAENSTLGNVNFLESNNGATAGDIVTDLIREDNNIAGKGNIGHRALILSARATRMGIGAAYGDGVSNNVLYSVQNGWFADDILRDPVVDTMVYPARRVFPYELVGKKTPWSFSTTKKITGTPKIYITDMTTKKRYRATQVRNFGTTFYGDGYTTTITYQPGKTKLINTHKYKVKIGKYYTYTFRFFRQKGHLK